MKLQSISWKDDVVTVTYGNGQVFTGDCAKLPASVFVSCDAARHGVAQKLGDAKSGGTAAQKFAEVTVIWQNLLVGEWNRRGSALDEDTIVEAAFLLLTSGNKKTVAGWMETWQKTKEEERQKVLTKPQMQTAYNAAKAKLVAERKAKAVQEADSFKPF